MIYFTSDLHLLRPDEHIFRSRGYESTQEMAEDYIGKINLTVKETDELYILGDILGGKLEESIKLFKQINCNNITVISGNYETNKSKELLVKTGKIKEMKDGLFVRLNDYKFFLCHFPCRTGDFSLAGDPIKRKIWSICGHTHTKDKFKELKMGWPAYHVEVDAHDGWPVSIEEIIRDIEEFVDSGMIPECDWEEDFKYMINKREKRD